MLKWTKQQMITASDIEREKYSVSCKLREKQCDDCGSDSVEWASLNKGVLFCSECCSFHNNLGSHASWIRHISKGVWDLQQLKLVLALNEANVNNIWEYNLKNSAKSRKPNKLDAAHYKAKFITEKYDMEAFVQEIDVKTEDVASLSRQLIACSRRDCPSLALRLLVLGARIMFADEDSNDTALHVAAREGNNNLVELYFLYGADLMNRNKENMTPYEVALAADKRTTATRLNELNYYISDQICLRLFSRKPQHEEGHHFILADLNSKELVEKTESSREGLSKITNASFALLVQDIYDEICRRENESLWNADGWGSNSKFHFALFLPPIPNLSASRNQRRQKLAKHNDTTFTALKMDVLKEYKRRIEGEELQTSVSRRGSTPATDASKKNGTLLRRKLEKSPREDEELVSPDGAYSSPGNNSSPVNASYLMDEILEIKERMSSTEQHVKSLAGQYSEIIRIMTTLQTTTRNLTSECTALREEVHSANRNNRNFATRMSPINGNGNELATSTSSMTTQSVSSPSVPPFSRRKSEDKPDGPRWRSSSKDRTNANVEQQMIRSPKPPKPESLRKPIRSLDQIIEEGQTVSKSVSQLGELIHKPLQVSFHEIEDCKTRISEASNRLIGLLPEWIPQSAIDDLINCVVVLNAKFNVFVDVNEVVYAAQKVASAMSKIIANLA